MVTRRLGKMFINLAQISLTSTNDGTFLEGASIYPRVRTSLDRRSRHRIIPRQRRQWSLQPHILGLFSEDSGRT